jgi:hypothetical protein
MNDLTLSIYDVDENLIAHEVTVIHDGGVEGDPCVVVRADMFADLVAKTRNIPFKHIKEQLANDIRNCNDREGIDKVVDDYYNRRAVTDWHDKYVSRMVEEANIVAAEVQDETT